ncbi:MAG TPA: ComEA family DNA-binding protein [Actinomycetota bacterium]|nr:ComEA family DNA-binding protein [Actinomycetota bacterium]
MGDGSLRERLSSLSRGELAGLVVLVLVTLGGAGLWYLRSLPRPVEVRAARTPVIESASPSPSPATILVDVAGWVREPGVYEFHEGDRVIDAIEAAGGARSGAALEALNLAAPLADGSQILVQKQSAVGSSSSPIASGSTGTAGTTAKININTAGADELDTLPGIGEVYAQRIVDYRTQNGPFASVDELEDVSGIGPATLENIRPYVTV